MTGSDVYSALRKSLLNDVLSALAALASPNSSTLSCGCARWAAAVAASAAADSLLDLRLVSGQLEGDQRRASVARELGAVASRQRRANVADVGDGAQSRHDIRHRRGERRTAGAHRSAALYEHLLAGLLGERVRVHAQPLPRLPVPHLGLRQVALTHRTPDHEHDQYEGSHPRIALPRCRALQRPASRRGYASAVLVVGWLIGFTCFGVMALTVCAARF